ncbi:SpoIVB peptidase [Tepidibacter formicigenes]|uniref:Stage IV sporulation protein B n=1 Tax=Tepidibacter formicigenes DSM 15518 TaxID=1123349 RepID=A0A1M6L1P3_9FIRM|nr:SpoIVB peptidase [Tepidibacter formicigenes]SHJ65151.1 stage IV sporulation protein B [Tepidibacter formicigenes DSM 15518]
MTKFSKKKMLFFTIILSIILTSFVSFNLFIQASDKDKLYLVPLGNVTGIKLDTKGVLVIGIDENYLKQKSRGIKIGDIIVKVENKEVNKAKDIENILNDISKNTVNITLKRDGSYLNKNIKLYKDDKSNKYKIGVWVRDKVAGIGTLTYYNPDTKEFSALGHGITDIDTGKLIEVRNGSLYKPKKIGIKKGISGVPGEIMGEFGEDDIIGIFNKNTSFGIKGKINNISDLNVIKPIEVGNYYEIKKGNAYLLFPDKNNNIKKYKIKIRKIFNQNTPKSKSMIVEIVDKELLEYTGGIVQGMSGAPIIQNGKLIGAITHVFVNDPKKGYAIFIDWMLK